MGVSHHAWLQGLSSSSHQYLGPFPVLVTGVSPHLRLMHHTGDTVSLPVFPPHPRVCLFPIFLRAAVCEFLTHLWCTKDVPCRQGDWGSSSGWLSRLAVSLLCVFFLHPPGHCGRRRTRPGHRTKEQLKGWKTRMGAMAASPAHKQARLPHNRSFPR